MRLSKFRADLFFNASSFLIMGICGVALNYLIANFYGASALGVFNQVFALYSFFSQFLVMGVHLSAQKYVSEYEVADRSLQGTIAFSALLVCAVLGCSGSLLFWLTSDAFGWMLSSPDVAHGAKLATVGLFFFGLNKVLVSVANGYGQIKTFATLRSLRFLFLIGSLIFFHINELPARDIPVIFTYTELMLFVPSAIIFLARLGRVNLSQTIEWAFRHFSFGFRGFLSGVFLGINTRVDVIMLGFFAGDATVGIYSLGAMFAEGLNQLPVLFRANFNPILAQKFSQGKKQEVVDLIGRTKRTAYLVFAPVFLAAGLLFPVVVQFIGRSGEFAESWVIFLVLAFGMYLASGYSPFLNLLIQYGRPGRYTVMISILVALNILLNLLLIPIYGIYGAASATATAYVFSVFNLRYFANRFAGLRI
jgi:O-antigen/teichoic acid export membrane protein